MTELAPGSVRLASANLLSGRRMPDHWVDHEQLREAVRVLDADVLAVQEVDVGQSRSGGVDQLGVVGDAAGAVWRCFVPTLLGTPGPGRRWRTADPGSATPTAGDRDTSPVGPAYGIGLVSRWPVRAWATLPLAGGAGALPMRVPTGAGPKVVWVPDEPRAAVAAVVDLTGGPVVVAGTHLSFLPGRSVAQLRRVAHWLAHVAAGTRPVVLLGDLNLPGRIPSWVTGWLDLVSGPTYPAAGPMVQLDHALAPNVGPGCWQVRSAETVRLPVSDHLAIVVTLQPAAQARRPNSASSRVC